MRRSFTLSTIVAVLTVGAAGTTTAYASQGGSGGRSNDCSTRNRKDRDLQVVGLVADGSLVCFREDRAERAATIGKIVGLDQDTRLIGIDHRPATNALYGLGDAGGVYVIDVATARATLVSRLNQPLQGASFGVDFNPTVDRLRVVSDTGQNLRVNVDDGSTTVDSVLNVPGTLPVSPALGVAAAAYTNNDADPNTATTLFDIDTTNDQVAIQAPPNAGSLNATGKLGVDAAGQVGFDIYSELRKGTTAGLRALASVSGGSAASLQRIDLLTGRATSVGTFKVAVVDIAIPTDQR